MKRWSVLILIIATGTLVACGPAGGDFWFRGGFEAAKNVAKEKDTLVFVEFYTDWCTWCRRLESETLTDRDVRQELDKFVSIRLNAEGRGEEVARQFGVETYPTMILVDPSGEEVERIVGYLPPHKFVKEVRRISTGDTLVACLQNLRDDPTNIDAIQRAVKNLLERSDPEGAISKIKHFHAEDEHAHEVCQQLMFRAGKELHYRVYLTAAKLYRGGWQRPIVVPAVPGSKRLGELVKGDLLDLDPKKQAHRMRTARFDDTAALLEMIDFEKIEGGDLYEAAEFAFRGGHYETAADLYGRWFQEESTERNADALNRAAWQLYLARESLDTAVAMAREAYGADPSADVADTLARLLYVSHDREEAIQLAKEAATKAPEDRAKGYRDVARQMKKGQDLGDLPAFETYPGPREISL